MVFLASTVLIGAYVLPSVMGLTLNTPTGAAADGLLAVTWTTVKGDPKFSMLMTDSANGEAFDIATGIDPTTGNTTVGLGFVPPGQYTLEAFNADDLETVLSTTGAFAITAAGTATPPATGAAGATGNNAAAGGAATGTGAAAGSGAATTGKKGKAGKGKGAKAPKPPTAKPAAPKPAAPKPAAPKPAAPKPAAPKPATPKAPAAKPKGFQKAGKPVSSVKFGRRELYRN
ncbi:hypothetical protein FB451DRAFT_1549306 [Mycena latifolia]|nr:hypothetical protein FB451DRAFT_1549306 [Mycena latifolia]